MFVVGNFLIAVASILGIILWFVQVAIILRVIISWVNADPYNVIVQAVFKITEPILQPVRRLMPPMGLDISPIIVWILIIFLNLFLVQSMKEYGYKLKQDNRSSTIRMELVPGDDSGTFTSR